VTGPCPLCREDGGLLVAKTARWRVIRADEPGFPAFYRLIWNEHVREFSDLGAADRAECMDAVAQVETLVRQHLAPTKMNVATLGNMVPHLHWHVIARFDWDSHFPAPVWAARQREPDAARLAEVEERRILLERELGKLGAAPQNPTGT
jgi:diadenosine tetraphosphate (Ap4A) HIT family hydrolase